MMGDKLKVKESLGLSVGKKNGISESCDAQGHYGITCTGADGEVKWTEGIENLVTTEGKNKLLDIFFETPAYTAAWYMGLQNGAAATVASTYAVPIVTEVTTYDEVTRQVVAFSAATAGSISTAAPVTFSINASVTINGVMLATFATKGDVAEVGAFLYSAGDFTGGAKVVAAGDTLNVTYTASL